MNGETNMDSQPSDLNQSPTESPEMAQRSSTATEITEDEQKYGKWMDANQRRPGRGRGRGRGRGTATGGRGDGHLTKEPLERYRGMAQHEVNDRSLEVADDDHVSARKTNQRPLNTTNEVNHGVNIRGGWSRGRYHAGDRGPRSQTMNTLGDYMERDAPSIFNQIEQPDPEANTKWEIALMKGKGPDRVSTGSQPDSAQTQTKPHLITSIADTNMVEPSQDDSGQEWRNWDPDPPKSHLSLVSQVTVLLKSQEGEQIEEKVRGEHSGEHRTVNPPNLDLEMESAEGETSRGESSGKRCLEGPGKWQKKGRMERREDQPYNFS
ncbi:hypothetical protein J5N97_027563 [Dioscorea zingiberensis]|uniref:Uncharacterized protein n=1 Tax=Dioscorea zingiberensis TaxID=325984 RepID=A0A9D5C4D5_9LILI|nr:hypothetical protein J5N97_027563 [Dioscorea zingiberensis]